MPSELKQKATKGFLWNSIENFSNQGISFLFTIILARILVPSDYGIVAMMSIFFSIAQTIVNCGFSTALIRKKDRTDEDMNTCFYFNIIVSLICYFLLFLTSPYIVNFYNQPILESLVKVAGIEVIINSFSLIQTTIFTIKIDFKTTAKITLASNILAGAWAIGLAYKGYGVWALVWKEIISSIVRMFLLWFASSWRPRWVFSWDSFHYLFGFGSKLSASYLIGTIYENIYPLVIGKFYSSAQLGNYSRALGWAQLPSSNVTSIIQRVTFPILSEMQDDDERLQINYRRLLRTSVFIIFPIMIGLAAIASPLIQLVLTPKWNGCIIYLQIICFALMWYPIHAINLNLLQVKGRSDLFLRLEIIKKIIGVAIMCVTIPLGITAMCVGMIVSSIFALAVNTYYTGKLIRVGFIMQMKDVFPVFVNSLIMGIAINLSITIFHGDFIKLLFGFIIGVILYFLGALIMTKHELQEVINVIKKK